jgi:hypothetical protein
VWGGRVISSDAILSAIHVMIDRLADSGDATDYYKLNNIDAADIRRLVRIVAVWLSLNKIDVEHPNITD